MGDRTYCNLNIQTPADEAVKALILGHLGDWVEDDGEDRWFGFQEVNYANLPDAFTQDMIALGRPFFWSWAAGSGYGPGIIICNGKETSEWSTDVDGNIVLSFDNIDNANTLASARQWDAVYTAIIRGQTA